MAFSYKLAELIAPRIAGGDPFKLGPQAAVNYEKSKNTAQANSLNEEQEPEEPQSEFIRSMFSDTLHDSGIAWKSFPNDSTIL